MLKKRSVYRNTIRVTLSIVRDIKQQRSIFRHYKISNFTITHSQKNPHSISL